MGNQLRDYSQQQCYLPLMNLYADAQQFKMNQRLLLPLLTCRRNFPVWTFRRPEEKCKYIACLYRVLHHVNVYLTLDPDFLF